MTLKKRKLIFYLLVALFFVIGAAVILYAQGWRFDAATWRASKVGGIFVRSFPDDARISLDKKPIQNDSSFLGRGTLIANLFPKTYDLELEKTGYDAWHENAAVSPSLVAAFKSAVLVPQNATSVAQGPVQKFFAANNTVVVQNTNGALSSDGLPIGKGTLIDEAKDGSAAIIKNNTNGKYSLYQSGNGGTTDLSAILAKSGAAKGDVASIFFDPRDPGMIVAAGPSKIWLIDTANANTTLIKNISAAATAKISAKEIIGDSIAAGTNMIAWTESEKSARSSDIMIYDTSAESIAASSTLPGQNSDLKWVKDGMLGILQNDGELYLYDTGTDSVTHIADDVKYFAPTADGSSVAALENKSMEIIPLTGNSYDYYRFNLPDIADARRVIWYKDTMHLFIEYGDRVSFLDLKDAGLDNFTTVAQGMAPFYDADNNALYLINPAQNLVRFDFPE